MNAHIVDLSARGKIHVSGRDAVDYLHRMLSNDVKSLAPEQSCYSFLLDAQGHILADMNVLKLPDSVLLDLEPGIAGRVIAHLDRFTFMDDVQFQDVTPDYATIGIDASQVPVPADGVYLIPGTMLVVSSARKQEIWDQLLAAGAAVADAATLEAARIEAGVPRFGVDFDEGNIPHETGQLRAISFTKGCYPGQEIVERVRSRGHVNRLLAVAGAENDAALEPGAKLLAEGREIGQITSAAFSTTQRHWFAIGIMRREFSEPGTHLQAGAVPVRVLRRC